MRPRKLFPTDSRQNASTSIEGRDYTTFVSNDYLGLSQNRELIAATMAEFETTGMGAGGSRLLGGDTVLAHALENKLAAGFGTESALVWASGYQTNLGVMSVLADKDTIVFADRFIHASWIDGIRLADTRLQRFRHNDMAHLESLLQRYRGKCTRAIILVESLYSMDGDFAPLSDLMRLKTDYDTLIVIDESHAFGAMGPHGFGCWDKYIGIERTQPFQSPLKTPVPASAETGVFIVGTFGKACGSYGAFVACDAHSRQAFIQSARSFIYSTGLPLPVLAWNLAAVSRFDDYRKRRDRLWANVAFFRNKIAALSPLGSSMIVPVLIDDDRADTVVDRLRLAGLWVAAVRYPTVPKGQSRLRMSLRSDHEESVLTALSDRLIETMGHV
jgi:8-amino-7-oxononanoate synthase